MLADISNSLLTTVLLCLGIIAVVVWLVRR